MRFNVPPELRELPLNTLRSHLYPRDPDEAAAGFVSYFDGQPAIEMPGRMATSQAQGQNALSLVDALELEHLRRKQLGDAVGTSAVQQPVYAVIDGGSMNHLPEPSDNIDPNLYTVPVARAVLQADDESLQAPELNNLSRQINEVRQANGQVADQRRQNAINSVQQQINALRTLVGGG